MRNDTTERIIEVLRSEIQKGNGDAIITRIVGNMKDADAIADDLEGMAEFPDYLSEREAVDIVNHFENFDGSRGAHWRDFEVLFNAAESYGVKPELSGHYNGFAFYAVMNMVWSDEWGVLRQFISQEDEAKVCAKLAEARLCDRDKDTPIRWYFGLD